MNLQKTTYDFHFGDYFVSTKKYYVKIPTKDYFTQSKGYIDYHTLFLYYWYIFPLLFVFNCLQYININFNNAKLHKIMQHKIAIHKHNINFYDLVFVLQATNVKLISKIYIT